MNLLRPLPVLTGLLLYCSTPALVTARATNDFLPAPTVCEYLETTGSTHKQFTWTLEQAGSWVLTSENREEIYRTWLDDQLNTEGWELVRPADNTAVSVKRDGDRLVVRGTLRGERVDDTLEIDPRPWYQELSLSLRNYLDGQGTSMEFWTLRPDNLDLHLLKCSAVSEEPLMLGTEKVDSIRVEVRLSGWRSAFWKGNYWFNRADGSFIRYEGDSGPPGCPPTVITPVTHATVHP